MIYINDKNLLLITSQKSFCFDLSIKNNITIKHEIKFTISH